MLPEADQLKGNVSHVGFLGGTTGKESACQCRKAQGFDLWVKKIRLRRDKLPTPVFLVFPGGSDGKESVCNDGRPEFNLWIGYIPWRRAWQPTLVFFLGRLQSMGSQKVAHD